MGWHGNPSQFTFLHYLTSEYRRVLSIPLMRFKTDFWPTFGAEINTMQLSRHNTHPASVQKINSASMTKVDSRGSCENQFLVGRRAPSQPITRRPLYTNEGFDCPWHLDQGQKDPICTPGSSDQIRSRTFASLGCIFGSALASRYKGQWPRWQGAQKSWKGWGIGDETRNT